MATALSNLSAYNSDAVPDGTSFTVHLVVSQWNDTITSSLQEGAVTTLLKHKVQESNIKVWNVPGSFELIYGAKKAQSYNPDAVIVIGSVIQGQTKHFDFVCEAVSQGIKDLNVHSVVPVIFCVLTDNTLEQAQDRSGGKHGNKGVEAAVAALQMIALRQVP
ncbi:6,7-dimethyl-8-ribityllumazine synthase [Flavobacteriaceae bacterium]|jgi:6,7-dimethyl-8-ribityllumazine synthase|nr:6,7-dimethyl-8-ribityllumazine synthase [Flavobacteriaceae bacterium]MDC0874094.1 6,7-dimethyl-8-ribityllumazine synthase [Flavobacteriaceae bacterium]MDC1030910.1 6,7-dimethyl-8-ribityllumazine synthase [Flavobacteriaceae bacterium]MDC3259746.1 6,7-dimethyl-8-ribityllumazine synthase [Flavobacteriaceae bacterium]